MLSLKTRFFNRNEQQQKAVPYNQETMSKCFCLECPTAPSGRGVFCGEGTRKKPIEQVCALGCDCVFCAVRHEYNLKGCYQCLNKKI